MTIVCFRRVSMPSRWLAALSLQEKHFRRPTAPEIYSKSLIRYSIRSCQATPLKEFLHERLRQWCSGRGVLAGEEIAVDDRVGLPDLAAGEVDAQLDQFVLGGPPGLGAQADRVLLVISVCRDAVARERRHTVPARRHDRDRRMTDDGKRLARSERGGQQPTGVGVLPQVLHRTVAAGVIDGVVVVQ